MTVITKDMKSLRMGKLLVLFIKPTLIDLTVMWKNNKNDDLFITRKDASEALL